VIEHLVWCVSVEGRVEVDFSRARRRAHLGRMTARLLGYRDRPLAFDEVRKGLRADKRLCLGGRVVEVSRVVGSVGRWRQFDGCFMPAEASTEDRCKRVDLAFRCGEELPMVSLYKLGEAYFVLDGNHRVSVACYHGVEWIDAVVTEFRPCVEASGREVTANHQECGARERISQRAGELWRG
jgi:hypothetical protein